MTLKTGVMAAVIQLYHHKYKVHLKQKTKTITKMSQYYYFSFVYCIKEMQLGQV